MLSTNKIDLIHFGLIFLTGVTTVVAPKFAYNFELIAYGYLLISLNERNQLSRMKLIAIASVMGKGYAFMAFSPFAIILALKVYRSKKRIDAPEMAIALFFTYATVNGLLFGINRFEIPLLYWLMTSTSCWGLFILTSRIEWRSEALNGIVSFVKKIILTELLICATQFLLYHAGLIKGYIVYDSIKGSFGNAHIVGYFSIAGVAYFAYMIGCPGARRISICMLISFGVIVILSDAKIFNLIFILSFAMITAFSAILEEIRRIVKLVAIGSALCLGVMAMGRGYFSSQIDDVSSVVDNISKIYFESDFSRKASFIKIVNDLSDESIAYSLFGAGAGQFGSHASELMAKNLMGSNNAFAINYPSPWVERYLSPLNSKDYLDEVDDLGGGRSYLLGVYNSSVIAIKSELGGIGILLWIVMMTTVAIVPMVAINKSASVEQRILTRTSSSLLIGLIFCSVFDQMMEYQPLILPILVLHGFVYSISKNNGRYNLSICDNGFVA